MDIKRVINHIVPLVQKNPTPPTVVYLEGGHYDIRTGPDEFAMTSQRAALDLGNSLIRQFGGRNARQQLRLVLGHLLGDLGMDCSDSECSMPQREGGVDALHPDITGLLAESRLYRANLFLAGSERRARNRGSSALKRTTHPSLSSKDGKLYFMNDEGASVFIADGNAERTGAVIPHCATIMATHYDWVFGKVGERFKGESPRTVIIDFSRLREERTVTTGAEMALRLFSPPDADRHIVNIFFANDQGEHYLVNGISRNDFE